jgi:hypothetical protein
MNLCRHDYRTVYEKDVRNVVGLARSSNGNSAFLGLYEFLLKAVQNESFCLSVRLYDRRVGVFP